MRGKASPFKHSRRRLEVKPGLTLVNGISGDPSVFFEPPQHAETVLFDLGHIDHLPAKDLLRVQTVLLSHTHLDHFIGFDRFLRFNVPHKKRRLLVGPIGIADRVYHRLNAYTWNLLQPGDLSFEVIEVPGPGLSPRAFVLRNENHFSPELHSLDFRVEPDRSILLRSDRSFQVECLALDHYIDSIAYILRFPDRYRVLPELLKAKDLSPGPWLGKLQKAMLENQADLVLEGPQGSFRAGDYAEQFLRYEKGYSLGYATDFGFKSSPISQAARFFAGIDILICETSFLDIDRDRALEKRHLSTKQAALLAALAQVDELINFHVSSVYGPKDVAVIAEAEQFFSSFKELDLDRLKTMVEEERQK